MSKVSSKWRCAGGMAAVGRANGGYMAAFLGQKGYRVNSSVCLNVPENYSFPYLERRVASSKTAHFYVSVTCGSHGMPGLRLNWSEDNTLYSI